LQGNTETRVGIFVLGALCVFVYMGFQVGAFRFNKGNYHQYFIYFNDVSGLSCKAEVKIAGVKVGWVEQVHLLAHATISARVAVMIAKEYQLYQDAYAIVRQDGLLGPHFIEIIPGNSLLEVLLPGDTLKKQNINPVSFDELMQTCQKIASHVEHLTDSFKESAPQLNSIINNLHTTAEKMASFSTSLEHILKNNENNIDTMLAIGTNIQEVTSQLHNHVLPAFHESIATMAHAFDRDFNSIAQRFDSTSSAIEEFSQHAHTGLHALQSVAEKINDGKGFIGRLVNEDDTYQDLKATFLGFKKYITQFERLQCVYDTHFEGMLRRAENYEYQDAKGYFDVRIHPNEHSFYVIQCAISEKGFAYRKNIERDYINLQGQPVSFRDNHVIPQTLDTISSNDLFIEPPHVLIEREQQFERNTIKFGLQFGKVYEDIALRFGLFEGTAGLGFDINIPFGTDNLRWISSFELFDMRGFNRRNDKRPHLKWFNRIFLWDNIYFVLGADDIVSKRNSSAFFGAGIRFGDEDVKYVWNNVYGMNSSTLQS
jgi:phospholipid/cholesterol/gamma-HCH transport system substrate-binding protein